MVERIVWIGEDDPAVLELLAEEVPAGFSLDTSRDALPVADYILNGALPVPAAMIAEAGRVRLIQRVGAGVDGLDVGEAQRRGVPVANLPGVNAAGVAEHTLLLVLAVLRRLCLLDGDTKRGEWEPNRALRASAELGGKAFGIVGLGHVGREVAARARAFGVTLRYFDAVRAAPEVERSLDIEYLPLAELLAACDVVTVHVPLTSATRHLIGPAELAAMRPGAVLVNVARGGVVDESALAGALRSGHLGGAGLDVWETEPVPPDHPLLHLPNVVATPHSAAQTRDTVRRVFRAALANVQRVSRGEPPLNRLATGAA